MSRTRKRILIVSMIVLLAGVCGYFYQRWWERVDYLRWLTVRQADLERLGRLLIVYDLESEAGFAKSWEDLAAAGVITMDETSFQDARQGVRVRRELRSMPALSIAGELVLVVESYEPSRGDWATLKADGTMVFERDIEEVIEDDNELRRAHGLDPIPWKASSVQP